MTIVLVSGRTLAANDFFNLGYIYMVRSGELMTLKKFPIQYAYVTHFTIRNCLHNRILGYGGASYNETGRIALGGNNKRWALRTVWFWRMRDSKRRLVPEAESLNLSSPWFLFNDFVVKNISEQEALSFQDKWKVRFLWSLSSGWSSSHVSRFRLLFTLSERIYKTHSASVIYHMSLIQRF